MTLPADAAPVCQGIHLLESVERPEMSNRLAIPLFIIKSPSMWLKLLDALYRCLHAIGNMQHHDRMMPQERKA